MTAHRYLGLDLGGTNIKSVVVEHGREPHVVASSIAPTYADRGPSRVVGNMIDLGRRLVSEYGAIDAVGVGVPGLFDRDRGTVELFPNLPGPWPGQRVRDPIAEGLGVRVTMVNDARAFTLAEGSIGAGRGCSTLVCVTLGTGVGGGVMVNGQLHLGAWGRAGEIGHQTVLPDGPRCGCGNRGCVEVLTQAEALADLAGCTSAEDVYARARAGDERCRSAIETVAGYLGIALANVVTVLGPDRIVVGGGIAAAGDLVLEPVRKHVRQRVTLVPSEEIEIVPAELGASAGAIGAALAAARRI